MERAAQRADLREGLHFSVVEDRDLRLRDPRFAQEEFGQRDVDDDLARFETGPPRDAILHAASLFRILERREDGTGCIGEFVAVRCEDALVQLAVLEPQRNLSLERALVHEPIEEFVVHHLLNLADRRFGPLDGPRQHFLRDPDGLVEVHGGIHQPAGHEHPLEGWQPFPIEGKFPPVGPQGL